MPPLNPIYAKRHKPPGGGCEQLRGAGRGLDMRMENIKIEEVYAEEEAWKRKPPEGVVNHSAGQGRGGDKFV